METRAVEKARVEEDTMKIDLVDIYYLWEQHSSRYLLCRLPAHYVYETSLKPSMQHIVYVCQKIMYHDDDNVGTCEDTV